MGIGLNAIFALSLWRYGFSSSSSFALVCKKYWRLRMSTA